MTEIYADISENVKSLAEATWSLVSTMTSPVAAAEFLNNVVEQAKLQYTEEEVEFLQFYFKLQMEMIANE